MDFLSTEFETEEVESIHIKKFIASCQASGLEQSWGRFMTKRSVNLKK